MAGHTPSRGIGNGHARSKNGSAGSSARIDRRRSPLSVDGNLGVDDEATSAAFAFVDGSTAPTAIVARLLDGGGGARRLTAEEAARCSSRDGVLWIHLDPLDAEARRWLITNESVSPEEAEALRGGVPQTRVEPIGRGRLLIAVLVAGYRLDDLHTFRLVVTADRTLTLFHGPLRAVLDVQSKLDEGHGPRTVPDLVATLVETGAARTELVLTELDRQIVDADADADADPRAALDRLRAVRREASRIRRGLARQREVEARLVQVGPPWLLEADPPRWKEITSRTADLADATDALLERTRGLFEDLQGRLATVLNDRLYLLTLLSAILLPLSLITGLLGVNLGGIPGTRQWWAFPLLCAGLAVLAVGGYFLARSRAWLPGARRRRRWLNGREPWPTPPLEPADGSRPTL